ncbi:MAG: helix-turn-helix transcriptional regulator [Lachnospiraceae bacterium]|nr:helix-turn-helix transcriptional regulator [Lachnospiraceae bacterium]
MKRKTPDSIHQNIRKYRLLNNMTQEELAEKLDLDTQYYAQLERGERNFTIEKIIRLCSIYHTGIENIIEVDFKEKQDTSELLQKLVPQIESLSYSQLIMLEKFINEILPYIK